MTGPLFHVGVFVNDRLIAEGQGTTKLEAERQAAEKAISLEIL